jgi:hypothetical protein
MDGTFGFNGIWDDSRKVGEAQVRVVGWTLVYTVSVSASAVVVVGLAVATKAAHH